MPNELNIKEKRQKLNLSQQGLSDATGIPRDRIAKWESGKGQPKIQDYSILVNFFSNNEVGNIVAEDARATYDSKKVIPFQKTYSRLTAPDNWQGVPVYDIEVTASFLEVIRDQANYQPFYHFQDPRFSDCNFGARITGDSMHPILRRGDYVICKEVFDFGFVLAGEIYLIMTTNGFETCKYIHPGQNQDELLLKAYNDNVPDQIIPRNYINRLFLVRGAIREF